MRIRWNDIPDSHFEEIVAALMRAMGFENVIVRTGGLDDGWDIDAESQQRNPDGALQIEKWRVECKRYKGTPPGEKIRDHYTRMLKTGETPDHIMFVTTGALGNPTKEDLEEFGKKDRVHVTIWERRKLNSLVEKYLHDPHVRALIAEYVDELFPLDLLREACSYQVTAEIQRRVGRKYLPDLCRPRPIEQHIEVFISSDLNEEQLVEIKELFRSLQMPALELDLQEQWKTAIRSAIDSRTKEEILSNTKQVVGLCDEETKMLLRQRIDGILSLQRNCFFIKDKAGSGKTNLLCRLAVLQRPNTVTMFLSCKFDLPSGRSLEEIVIKALHLSLEHQRNTGGYQFALPKNPPNLFDSLMLSLQKHKHELVIFLDGVNENRDLSSLDEAVLAILSRWNGLPIKFIITCRDIFWGFFSSDQWGRFFYKNQIHDLPGFDTWEIDGIIDAYFNAFQIRGRLSGIAREKCCHPLLLRFFCEAYQGRDILVFEDLRLKDLFEVYWHRKRGEISQALSLGQDGGRRVEDFLFRILTYMSDCYVTQMPLGEVQQLTGEADLESTQSLYQHFLDQDIILEEMPPPNAFDSSYSARRISFVYDEFYDYMMALHHVRTNNWDSLDLREVCLSFLKLIDRSKVFEQFQGVAEYLVLIAEQKKMHRALCATLARLGNYTILCNVLPKLKDEKDWAGDVLGTCLLSLSQGRSGRTELQTRYDEVERVLVNAPSDRLYEHLQFGQ